MIPDEEAAQRVHAAICEESLADCLDPDWRGRCVKAVAAAAPHIQAQALRDAADEQSRRSETLLKTMEGMVSAGYGSEDILRYGAFSAEAQTTAYRLRARADRLEGK